MSPMKRVENYRLPTKEYKTTTSVERYSREWRRIGSKVAKSLGCSLAGFNPGFLLVSKEGQDYLDLSLDMALRLHAIVAPPKPKQEEPAKILAKKTIETISSLFGVRETIDLGSREPSAKRLAEALSRAVLATRKKNMDEKRLARTALYYSREIVVPVTSACESDDSLRNRLLHRPEAVMPSGAIVVGSFSPGVPANSILIRWGAKK